MLFTALFLLLVVVWLVFIADNKAFDEDIFNCITPYISESRTNLMKGFSFLGNHKFLIPANLLLVVYLLLRKNKEEALTAAVVSLSSVALMSLLKNVVHRHRPPDPLVDGITNFSFPSGHAFMSVVFYGLIAWWATIYLKKKWQSISITIFFSLLILVICFSRIYLRVHYTTDIIAGLCIGISWLLISLSLMGTLQRSRKW